MASGNINIIHHLAERGTSQRTKEQYLSEGIAYYQAKQYQLALVACKQAIQLDSNYARAFHGKGLALWELTQYEEAIIAFRQALFIHPQNGRVYVDLARVYYELRRFKESGEMYRQAIPLDY